MTSEAMEMLQKSVKGMHMRPSLVTTRIVFLPNFLHVLLPVGESD